MEQALAVSDLVSCSVGLLDQLESLILVLHLIACLLLSYQGKVGGHGRLELFFAVLVTIF